MKRDSQRDFRKQAEEKLRVNYSRLVPAVEVMTSDEIRALIQELDVHQIELEMQNDELQLTQIELDDLRASYFELYNLAPVGYLVVSEEGIILNANLTATRLVGLNRNLLEGMPLTQLIFSEDQDIYYLKKKALVASGETQTCELRITRAENSFFWSNLSLTASLDSEGSRLWRIIFTDISEKKLAETNIKESEHRMVVAQRLAHVGSWERDLETNMITATREFFDIHGLTFSQSGLSIDILQHSALAKYRETLEKSLFKLINLNEDMDEEYMIMKQDTGEECYVHCRAKLVFDEIGHKTKVTGTIQDITDQKKREDEIIYLSYHDQLTGLYNRRFYMEELKRLDTARDYPLTIAMGDVNGLKLINDTFGHMSGDELLKKVAEVIRMACRGDDIIARLGGDEFIIILPRSDESEAKEVIDRITNLSSGQKIGSIDVSITFATGTKYSDGEDIHDIFKQTENRMYTKKTQESACARSKAVKLMMNTLFENNVRDKVHARNVSDVCKMIAQELNFENKQIEQLKMAGMMHDIGKIGIEEKILNKPAKLTSDEFLEIMRHPEIGYRILNTVNEFSEIAEFVLEHHEKWDGTGYPKGLKGNDISIQARIIAVADAFDSMTSFRTYDKEFTVEEGIEELSKCAGTQFDPDITNALEKAIAEEPALARSLSMDTKKNKAHNWLISCL